MVHSGTLGAPWSLVLALFVFHLMSTKLGLRRCAYRWARSASGGRWGHSLRDPCVSDLVDKMPNLQAFQGQPSLVGDDACVVFWAEGAFWRNCRQNLRKTSFSRFWFFF